MTEAVNKDFHVIYLTGAPATGKTALLDAVAASRPDVARFSYGEELTGIAKRRVGRELVQADIRRESADLISPDDVRDTDEWLTEFAEERRKRQHVVIDSHPVTKEQFGFRVTAFSLEQLRRVGITRLCCLYCQPEVVIDRIASDPQGRPNVGVFETTIHGLLQDGVVATYGVLLGLPVYYLDSTVPPAVLLRRFEELLLG